MRRLALAGLLFSACVQCLHAAEPAAIPTTRVPAKSESVPFRLEQGYVILVRGNIGNRKDLNLMVETGASSTVIDRRLARQLGICGKEDELALPNATLHVQSAEVADLQIGPLRKTRQRVIIGDLTNLRAQLGLPVDALIGLDVLGDSNFTIDFQHKRFVFGLSQTEASIPYETADSLVIATLHAGSKPFRVLIDTGASGLLLFRNGVRHRVSGITFLGGEDMRNLGGWMRVDRVTIDDVRMGERRLGTTPASIAENQQSKWSAIFDGVLGPSSLHLKRLVFDVEHHTLGWTK